jgi:replicative DNA helicase
MSIGPLYENESEKSFLAHLLLKGATGGTEFGVVPEDFFNDLHKRIFTSILEITDSNIPIDPLSVTNNLREKGRFKDESKESEYIINLYSNAIVVQPLTYYSRRIKKLSDRRKYIRTLQDAIETVYTDPDDNENLFTKVEVDLSKISRTVQNKGLKSVKDDKGDLVDYVKLMVETKGLTTGLKTHFKELDNITTGLKQHELMILAARPGIGKTTLALNIAANVSIRDKKTVAIFSLEMSRMELLIKLICSEARFNSKALKTGLLSKDNQMSLLKSIIAVTSSPLYIDDSGALTIWEFKNRVRQLQTTTPLSLIIVDYLQIMEDPTVRDGRQAVVSSISRNLKQMAKEANCPVIALSQMSREVEKRSKDQRPQLSDLRESGAIEQDADIVAFIHREFKDGKSKNDEEENSDRKDKAEIIIAKNRSGVAQVSFDLLFTPEYGKFTNL